MSSEKPTPKFQIWIAIISLIGVLGTAVLANIDKITNLFGPSQQDASVANTAKPDPIETEVQDPLVGDYEFATDTNRLIKITALGSDRYIAEEPVRTQWPWKGTLTKDGNRINGMAEFPDSKATMRIKGEIRSDGSIVVRYEFITLGDGSLGDGTTHPHVWVKRNR
jgi:hypothetical protein